MIKIKNRQLKPVAILENAYGVGYELIFNGLSSMTFSLPLDDPKNKECVPFNFVELTDGSRNIGMFRIVPTLTVKDESTNEIQYTAWHVISTLLDDVLFRFHQTTNWTTRQNIEYILAQQTTVHWVLKDCAFTRYFHYGYENENGLLGPLFSIPKPFDQEYEWKYNTEVYPFELNLVEPSQTPTCEIREAHNQIGIEKEEPNEIINRIYALGYGEGVNQLGIEEVNNGLPYVEDAASIAKYGLHSYVWIDRRFQDAVSLKANADSLLKKWANPIPMYRVSAGDVSSFTDEDIHKLICGRVARTHDSDLGTFDLRIMREQKGDMFGSPGEVDIDVGSLTDDIATLQADLDKKMRINEAYAQGNTHLDTYSYNDNADSNHPAIIRFYLPEELVNVNKLELTYEVDYFRSYDQATEGGGAVVSSTSSGGGTVSSTGGGGGTVASSSSGGGTSSSTSSGGGTVESSGSNGDHNHLVFAAVEGPSQGQTNRPYLGRTSNGQAYTFDLPASGADIYTYGSSGQHSHNVSIPSHQHSFSTPNHSHTITLNNHTHSITLENHSHDITIPNHTHQIKHGIYKHNTLPSSVELRVDGNLVSSSEDRINIIPFLSKDGGGKVLRGQWHEVSIKPNGLGRINANIFGQYFLQSRGGVKV